MEGHQHTFVLGCRIPLGDTFLAPSYLGINIIDKYINQIHQQKHQGTISTEKIAARRFLTLGPSLISSFLVQSITEQLLPNQFFGYKIFLKTQNGLYCIVFKITFYHTNPIYVAYMIHVWGQAYVFQSINREQFFFSLHFLLF